MSSLMKRPSPVGMKRAETLGLPVTNLRVVKGVIAVFMKNVHVIVFLSVCAKLFQLKLLKQNFEELVFRLFPYCAKRGNCTFYSTTII